MNKGHSLFISALVLIWLVMLAIVNPIGNFPLNDDWMYSRPVQYLIQHGFYYSPDYYSPVLCAQVFWGSIFCLPFGFSFTALRISTLVLGLAGIIVFYLLVYNFSNNKRIAFLAALLVMVNPLYFSLANTFMTDVPFLAFSFFSVFFYTRYLQRAQSKFLYLAIALSIIATLIRQFGVVIPLAYGITLILKNKPKWKGYVSSFIPAILSALALYGALKWLVYIGSPLQPYQGSTITGLLSQTGQIANNIYVRSGDIIYYAGFFLLPLLLVITVNAITKLSARQKIGAGVLVLLFLPSLINRWGCFPIGNVFNDYFIGPKTLRDTTFLHLNNTDGMPSGLLHVFWWLALLGGLLLLINIGSTIATIFKEYRSKELSETSFSWVFVAFFFLGYAFLMFVSDAYFDRYLLAFIPLSALLIVAGDKKGISVKMPAFIFSAIFIASLALFSSCATHDYLEWNRARWKALNYLNKEMKVSPMFIDGGYEYNGWRIGPSSVSFSTDKSWWFVDDDEYLVTFGPVDGYDYVKPFACNCYLPNGPQNLFILHRKAK
ncbi:MAG TPA: glycosyltransferase family 39 protein [Bacteroidia bacterium]|nr:glycosyltransferase family 39 protein [Bacteroidia bacterium]